jgi:hypothetical protein
LYEEAERAIDRKAQRRRFNVRNMGTGKSREELTDLYLLDKLLPQDREDFEEEMLRDDELHKEVETMRHIITGFERKGEVEAIDAMQNMSEEQIKSIIADTENGYKRPVKRRWLYYSATIGIAASIVLLLYIGFQPKYSSVELYDSFYAFVAYEYIPSRGGGLNEDQEHLLEQAVTVYNQGNYAEALSLFDSITTNENVSEEIKFYAALCMVQTGKEPDAKRELEYIAHSVDSEFKDDALWNLALLYLKIEDRNRCSSILQSITDDKNNPYANDADRLLNKLNTRRWF